MNRAVIASAAAALIAAAGAALVVAGAQRPPARAIAMVTPAAAEGVPRRSTFRIRTASRRTR